MRKNSVMLGLMRQKRKTLRETVIRLVSLYDQNTPISGVASVRFKRERNFIVNVDPIKFTVAKPGVVTNVVVGRTILELRHRAVMVDDTFTTQFVEGSLRLKE